MSGDLALWTLAGLGAYHGLNPAMGWLFAVSRGMQERSRRAVIRSLGPIALGHELSIAVVAVIVVVLSAAIDLGALRIGAAVVLVAFGLFRFARPRAHPRWTTMRVSNRELTWWSFLMSSAHGAGLMIAPVLIGIQGRSADSAHEHADVALLTEASLSTGAVGLLAHVGAMLAVMAFVAILVYDRLGVAILRRAWLNTDHLWAGAFVAAGVITLVS